MKIVKHFTWSDFEKSCKRPSNFLLIKVIMNKLIPGDSATIRLGKPVDIEVTHVSFVMKEIASVVWSEKLWQAKHREDRKYYIYI